MVFALRTRRAWFLMKQRAEERGGGWARIWDEGFGDEIKWCEPGWIGHGAVIEDAISMPP
ncbi:hypothetical protein [Nonomuraea gerenzanensis]|uniref:hypothetical protein n=1 Tax=Nonomuraea gerenzanensis TaxID=93944 RepID=UPI001CDA1B7A|nr:hypothetical protein [Nonomuraea gerenzanensis]UBU13487.1 hypothetical protein LCN96_00150 [Nonomuraea gerenzanensis]